MSNNEVRQALADAASSLDGINVTPYFRQTTKPGEGMVRLDRMNRAANGFGFMCTWQVIVLLPQDIATAEKYLDQRISDLVEAVSEELVVTSVAPQQLTLDTGTVPCIFIEGNREQE